MQQKRLESQYWQQQRSQCQIRLPSIQLVDYETSISSSLLSSSNLSDNTSLVQSSNLPFVGSFTEKCSSFTPTRSWIQSIYKRCNFSRRAGTTSKPPVPRGLYEECKLSFLVDIKNCVKQYNVPPELILNADQTPSSYVSVGRMTMAQTNSQSVPIKGLADKRNITLTFVISMSDEFLPLQIIYQGKSSN